MALWALYGGLSNSVVITSTIGCLIDLAHHWNRTVLIEKVKYIDHFKNPDMIIGSYMDLLRFKHEAYSYEKEIRVIVPTQNGDWKNNAKGIRLPVKNLNKLIRSVVVAPEADAWFYDLVAETTLKYEVSSPVRRSKLTYLPK